MYGDFHRYSTTRLIILPKSKVFFDKCFMVIFVLLKFGKNTQKITRYQLNCCFTVWICKKIPSQRIKDLVWTLSRTLRDSFKPGCIQVRKYLFAFFTQNYVLLLSMHCCLDFTSRNHPMHKVVQRNLTEYKLCINFISRRFYTHAPLVVRNVNSKTCDFNHVDVFDFHIQRQNTK